MTFPPEITDNSSIGSPEHAMRRLLLRAGLADRAHRKKAGNKEKEEETYSCEQFVHGVLFSVRTC
jgi:G:T-mismatch repair DNA endonuclease (very short patch repair protein)